MIENGEDDALRELHAFLYSDSDIRPPTPDPVPAPSVVEKEIWTPGLIPGDRFFRLFISHTHHHKKEVAALKTGLIGSGVSGFIAHQDIKPTRDWLEVIETALRTCDALLAYITPEFRESSWTDQEVGVAFGRDLLIVPVSVGVDPYGFMGQYQGLPGTGRDPRGIAALVLEILREDERTRGPMAEAAVDRFCHSYSWNNARDNLTLIRRIPAELWTPDLIRRVRDAAVTNSEVATADIGFGESTVSAEAIQLVDALKLAA